MDADWAASPILEGNYFKSAPQMRFVVSAGQAGTHVPLINDFIEAALDRGCRARAPSPGLRRGRGSSCPSPSSVAGAGLP